MMNLIYLADHILYQIFMKHETVADSSPVEIYTNKIENCIMFKNKKNYKLKLLSKETMRLLGSTEQVFTNDKSNENVSNLANSRCNINALQCFFSNNFQSTI